MSDRNKLVWRKDKLQGSETAYTYDTSGRVTGASNDYGLSPQHWCPRNRLQVTWGLLLRGEVFAA